MRCLARPLLNLPICMHCELRRREGKALLRLQALCPAARPPLLVARQLRPRQKSPAPAICVPDGSYIVNRLSAMHLVFSPQRPWASAANHVWGWPLATICCIASPSSWAYFLSAIPLPARADRPRETTWEHLRRADQRARAASRRATVRPRTRATVSPLDGAYPAETERDALRRPRSGERISGSETRAAQCTQARLGQTRTLSSV